MLQVSRPSGGHRAPRPSRTRRLGRFLVVATGSVVGTGSVVATGSVAATGSAVAVPAVATPLMSAVPAAARSGDHLTVTVRNAGDGVDGRYELYCHPGGGDHPDVSGACAALDRGTRWGKDAFSPVPDGSVCTMQYGGAATAHVTGTWRGRPVDARFDRGDGCEIARWDRMVPVLPDLRRAGRV
ncbi:SSI family serine proteinase inhibitor [Streptomyces sp. NPDC002779]|uniref:SSI family serine proteinase inhibitor n=1 Tax=Streptomyces sp. NPDC002779 TaxID=3364664 RepID=UPI00369FF489